MKIGVPSLIILLSYIYIYMIIVLSNLSFTDIDTGVLIGNISMIFFVIFYGYYLIKETKIILTNNQKIICFYPFLWKQKEIFWNNTTKINLTVDREGRGLLSRTIAIEDKNQQISFSDFGFINFSSLTNQIPNGNELRKNIDIEQAKHNMPLLIIIVILCIPVWSTIMTLFSSWGTERYGTEKI